MSRTDTETQAAPTRRTLHGIKQVDGAVAFYGPDAVVVDVVLGRVHGVGRPVPGWRVAEFVEDARDSGYSVVVIDRNIGGER